MPDNPAVTTDPVEEPGKPLHLDADRLRLAVKVEHPELFMPGLVQRPVEPREEAVNA